MEVNFAILGVEERGRSAREQMCGISFVVVWMYARDHLSSGCLLFVDGLRLR